MTPKPRRVTLGFSRRAFGGNMKTVFVCLLVSTAALGGQRHLANGAQPKRDHGY
jgi:hypothetical protein